MRHLRRIATTAFVLASVSLIASLSLIPLSAGGPRTLAIGNLARPVLDDHVGDLKRWRRGIDVISKGTWRTTVDAAWVDGLSPNDPRFVWFSDGQAVFAHTDGQYLMLGRVKQSVDRSGGKATSTIHASPVLDLRLRNVLILSTSVLVVSVVAFVGLKRFEPYCRPGLCRNCGYDLRGQTEPRCPECGTPFDADS